MSERLRLIWAGMVQLWCDWTHGGGHVLRDPSGRVNWQCAKCGRWADPVPDDDEANLLKRHISVVYVHDAIQPNPDADNGPTIIGASAAKTRPLP